jgi:CDP-diglyceride synthetase
MQMTMIDLAEPLRDPVYYFTNIYWRDTSLPSLMPGGDVCMKHPRACRPNLTIEGLELVHGTVIALSLGFIGWRLTRRNLWKDLVQRQAPAATSQNLLLGTVLILLLAIVANAAVTGILSGPFARYHARMVWLAPALAILLGIATGPGFDFASWAKRRLKQR